MSAQCLCNRVSFNGIQMPVPAAARSTAARLLDRAFESHRGHECVSVVCCQVGLCDELITRPEESY
jgi:hypothetical protein